MDIKPAQETDIIDILYLWKREMGPFTSQEGPAGPPYDSLRKSIARGRLFIMKHHRISIGTFSVGAGPPDGQTAGGRLEISGVIIASYWINRQTIEEVLRFSKNMALEQNHHTLVFHIPSQHEKLNTFYRDQGLDYTGQYTPADSAIPFNLYQTQLHPDPA